MFPNQNYNSFNLSVFSGVSCPLIFPFAHGQILNKGTKEEETHCASYYSVHSARYQPDTAPWHHPWPHVMAQVLPSWWQLHKWTWSGSLWPTLPCDTLSPVAIWEEINISRPKIKTSYLEDFLVISHNLPWQHFLPWNESDPLHRPHDRQGSHWVGHVKVNLQLCQSRQTSAVPGWCWGRSYLATTAAWLHGSPGASEELHGIRSHAWSGLQSKASPSHEYPPHKLQPRIQHTLKQYCQKFTYSNTPLRKKA